MTNADDLAELAGYIAEHVTDIPQHRQRQALLILERVERLIPLPDGAVDDPEAPNPPTKEHPHD